MSKETDKQWTFLKLCGLAIIIIFFCSLILLILVSLKQGMKSMEREKIVESICEENNLTFVDDYWGKGRHCAKIENNIAERYYVEELNDGEFYLIKR